MPEEKLKELLQDLPARPGVYKYYDKNGRLIYVGKAKNLRKRVSSYFHKQHQDAKTRRLVKQIMDLEFTITNNEFDAFLLENNLIKNYQPKYNILLKDDKTYPFLYISNERFPRLISSRSYEAGKGTYYGPYTSVKAMNTVSDLIRKLFSLRTCNYNLSEENVENRKYKVCLEFHIGNCKAPCEGLVPENEYNDNIAQIHQILRGNVSLVKNHFKQEMKSAAGNLEFEKAQKYKEKLSLLEKFQSKSVIVNPSITDIDVLSIVSDENTAVINYLKIIQGAIQVTKNFTIKKNLNETDEEVLLAALLDIRNKMRSDNKEIITNIKTNLDSGELKITTPVIGDKKKLVDLSWKNAKYHLQQLRIRKEEKVPKKHRVLKELQEKLLLKKIPYQIECFDNSNIQGTNPVAAMVCFKNGVPSKKDYRHYNIKTVTGPDDFASMHEIVKRRYQRLLSENKKLPELIIIDGGKGQLSAAVTALMELKIHEKVPVFGIAKRLEEIYRPGDSDPLFIDKKSEALKLLQHLRNEAHRFAINFHRTKRSSNFTRSALMDIPGIGESTIKKLLGEFGSVKRIKAAEEKDLARVVGQSKAELIRKSLSE